MARYIVVKDMEYPSLNCYDIYKLGWFGWSRVRRDVHGMDKAVREARKLAGLNNPLEERAVYDTEHPEEVEDGAGDGDF